MAAGTKGVQVAVIVHNVISADQVPSHARGLPAERVTARATPAVDHALGIGENHASKNSRQFKVKSSFKFHFRHDGIE